MKRYLAGFFLCLSFVFFSASTEVGAQVRSQGKVLSEENGDVNDFAYRGPTVDYAEEMRRFIQAIGKYGRQFKRDFIVLIKDGSGLLTQIVDVDQQVRAPSSAFLSSIDGIIQPSLSYGFDEYGKETGEKDQKRILEDLQAAIDRRLKVFTLEYVSKPADVDKAIRFAAKRNFTPFAASGMGYDNNKIPNWPPRPYQENEHTITNAQMIKNYLLINDSSRMGTRDEFAMKIHNTNYDMVAVNVFHHRTQPHGPHNVRTMQFKKLGARRPVLAQMDIGTADAGAYYWKPEWSMGNPPWLLDLAPYSSDKYLVQYWHPSWQQLIYGNEMSYMYGIIKEGYDGVVLNGVEVYELFANPQ